MIRKTIADIIYPEYAKALDVAKSHSENHLADATALNLKIKSLTKLNVTQNDIIESQNAEIISIKLEESTDLEEYCDIHFKEYSKYAYKNKRKYNKIEYSVYPNELIQPDKYLVNKARKELRKTSASMITWVKKVGNYVDKKLKWTADSKTESVPDYYSSPVESLLEKQKDCEDHSFLAASLEPELGVAFGYCGDGGHAWNVFVSNGELYCLETNSTRDYNNCVRVFKYSTQNVYKIHWIFTKDKTYKVAAKAVNFGIRV